MAGRSDDTDSVASTVLEVIRTNCSQSDAVTVLAMVANTMNIKTADFTTAREDLQPSLAKWAKVAVELDLPDDISCLRWQLEPYGVPTCWLPPSFHVATFEAAWRFQDIYQEMFRQNKTALRLRMLDPYLEPVMAFFQGRIMDIPYEQRYADDFSLSGGEVEHKLLLFGETLFIIIQLRNPDEGSFNNCLAHLLLEFLSSVDRRGLPKSENLRVYGLITDLMTFQFYSYDVKNKEFNLDENLDVSHHRESFCYEMIPVINKIFSIVLNGYVEALEIWVSTKCTANENDSAASMVAPVPPNTHARRPDQFSTPTQNWIQALSLAHQSHAKFQLPFSDMDTLEATSTEGIRLLTESVHLLPRQSKFTGKIDPLTEAELNEVAQKSVQKWHETLLKRS